MAERLQRVIRWQSEIGPDVAVSKNDGPALEVLEPVSRLCCGGEWGAYAASGGGVRRRAARTAGGGEGVGDVYSAGFLPRVKI